MQREEPGPKPETRRRAHGPRGSLHRRLLLWVLLATAAPIALVALIQTRVTHMSVAEAPVLTVDHKPAVPQHRHCRGQGGVIIIGGDHVRFGGLNRPRPAGAA